MKKREEIRNCLSVRCVFVSAWTKKRYIWNSFVVVVVGMVAHCVIHGVRCCLLPDARPDCESYIRRFHQCLILFHLRRLPYHTLSSLLTRLFENILAFDSPYNAKARKIAARPTLRMHCTHIWNYSNNNNIKNLLILALYAAAAAAAAFALFLLTTTAMISRCRCVCASLDSYEKKIVPHTHVRRTTYALRMCEWRSIDVVCDGMGQARARQRTSERCFSTTANAYVCTVCGCVSVYAKRLKFEFSQSVRVRVCALVCMHWWICHGVENRNAVFVETFRCSVVSQSKIWIWFVWCLLSVNIHEILSVPLGSTKAQFWLLFNFDFFHSQ